MSAIFNKPMQLDGKHGVVSRVSSTPSRWELPATLSDEGRVTLSVWHPKHKKRPWLWEIRRVEGIYEWADKHPVVIAPPTSCHPGSHLYPALMPSGYLTTLSHPIPPQELPSDRERRMLVDKWPSSLVPH